jgi:hypothetical protein
MEKKVAQPRTMNERALVHALATARERLSSTMLVAASVQWLMVVGIECIWDVRLVREESRRISRIDLDVEAMDASSSVEVLGSKT